MTWKALWIKQWKGRADTRSRVLTFRTWRDLAATYPKHYTLHIDRKGWGVRTKLGWEFRHEW